MRIMLTHRVLSDGIIARAYIVISSIVSVLLRFLSLQQQGNLQKEAMLGARLRVPLQHMNTTGDRSLTKEDAASMLALDDW